MARLEGTGWGPTAPPPLGVVRALYVDREIQARKKLARERKSAKAELEERLVAGKVGDAAFSFENEDNPTDGATSPFSFENEGGSGDGATSPNLKRSKRNKSNKSIRANRNEIEFSNPMSENMGTFDTEAMA